MVCGDAQETRKIFKSREDREREYSLKRKKYKHKKISINSK